MSQWRLTSQRCNEEDFKSGKQEENIMRKISTDKAPAAIGPYSQAVLAGDFLYASGQIPINPATGNVEEIGRAHV